MNTVKRRAFNPSTVREAAAELLAAAADGGELKGGFDAAAARFADPRDKALLKELVYGSLRAQTALDDLLTRASGHKVFRVDPRLAPILRVAAHQLIHLDRIPAHAAVDAAVEHARRRAGAKRAGFVNAVLRNLARRKPEFRAQQRALPGAGGEALRLGYPHWIHDRLADEFGAARAGALAAAFNAPAALTVMPLDESVAPPEGAEPGPLGSFHFPAGAAGAGRELAQRRDCYAADLASVAAAALVASALEAAPPGRLLDCCAAPGGKSILLKKFRPAQEVLAMDASPARLARLRENLGAAAGAPLPVAGDLLRAPLRRESQAAVWLDAPCSALGTLRKSPEKRHQLEPEGPALHAARQRELLAAAAELVQPGGLLVYTVCSPLAVETREVIAEFLAGRADFAPLPLAGPAAQLPWEPWGAGFVALPDRADWEGFFIALMRRARPAG